MQRTGRGGGENATARSQAARVGLARAIAMTGAEPPYTCSEPGEAVREGRNPAMSVSDPQTDV